MNPLKQSNVFKSFSNRRLLPRPSPDLNDNGKESAEEKKVNNATKEINATTNNIRDNSKNISSMLHEIKNDSRIHNLNIKLDTMSAEIINILELLENNKTQTGSKFTSNNYSLNEDVENESNSKAFADEKLKNLVQNMNILQRDQKSDLEKDDILVIENVTTKMQNINKINLNSLNYAIPPTLILDNQDYGQDVKAVDNNITKNENKVPNPAFEPKQRIYTEEYLRNTIFYDDDFDNDRAYKVQDNKITDRDKYVNAEVVIF